MADDSSAARGSGSLRVPCSQSCSRASSACEVSFASTLAETQPRAARGHFAFNAGSILTMFTRLFPGFSNSVSNDSANKRAGRILPGLASTITVLKLTRDSHWDWGDGQDEVSVKC